MLPSIIILSVILLAIVVLSLFKKNLDNIIFKYLLLYLCTNFVFEAIAFYLIEHGINNIHVYNVEMIFEVSFFLILFKKSAFSFTYKRAITIAVIAFIVFAIINIIFSQSIIIFNSNTYTLGSFFLIFACGIYLYNSILKNEDRNPLFSLMFWVSLGVLFCYLGNFPFLSNVNQLFIINENMALRLQVISISVNVLLYLLITVGILCNRKA